MLVLKQVMDSRGPLGLWLVEEVPDFTDDLQMCFDLSRVVYLGIAVLPQLPQGLHVVANDPT